MSGEVWCDGQFRMQVRSGMSEEDYAALAEAMMEILDAPAAQKKLKKAGLIDMTTPDLFPVE